MHSPRNGCRSPAKPNDFAYKERQFADCRHTCVAYDMVGNTHKNTFLKNFLRMLSLCESYGYQYESQSISIRYRG